MTEPDAPQRADALRIRRGSAVAVVVGGLLVSGVLTGALWAVVAPPIHGVVALPHSGGVVQSYLGDEADNFFVAAFLMLGMLTVLATVASVLVWQWQAHRGPAMVVGLSTGVVAAAAAAVAAGALLVHLRYGLVDVASAPVTPKNPVYYFREAPPVFFGQDALQVACTLLLPAAAAALVYALLVAAATDDDLGGYPAADAPAASAAVTVSSGRAAPEGC